MPDVRRRTATPWIVAGVVGVLLAGLVIAYVALRSYREDYNPGAFTSDEKAAVAAARTDVHNLLSFRRAQFEADFARALASVTGPLRSDLSSKKASLLSTMTSHKVDLSVTVTHVALIGSVGSGSSAGYSALVTINGYSSTNVSAKTPANLRVTIQKVKGKLLLSNLEQVGLV